MITLCTERAELDAALFAEPDILTPDMYQDAIEQQILVDERVDDWSRATVRGVPLEAKFYMGVREEAGETEEDDPDPDHKVSLPWLSTNVFYDRNLVLQVPTYEFHQNAPPEAIMYHRKEFGDLAWYTVNSLTLYGIRMRNVMRAELARLGGDAAQLHTVRDFDEQLRKLSGPAEHFGVGHAFLTASGAMIMAAENMLRPLSAKEVGADAYKLRWRMLEQTAGRLLGCMSLALQLRLGTSLAPVLYDNIQKVEGRAIRGTTFSGSGDKR